MTSPEGGVPEASPPLNPAPVLAGYKNQSLSVRQRRVAKVGLTAAMGAVVVTGFMRGRGAKTLHIWSGIALVGLSVWHHQLYHRS